MSVQHFYISVSVGFFCNPCSSLMECPGGHLGAAEHLLKIPYDFIFFPEIKSLHPFPSLHITNCRCALPGVRSRGTAWPGLAEEVVVAPPAALPRRHRTEASYPSLRGCSWPVNDHIPSFAETTGQPQGLDLRFLNTDTQARKLPS